MRRYALITFAVIAGLTGPAVATHNVPAKAKLLKLSFVPAEDPCTAPTLDHRLPLGLVVHGCPPSPSTNLTATNNLTFAADGSLTATIKAKKGDVRFSFKGQGVLNNGAPLTGTLIAVATLRVTDHACGSGTTFTTPCTVQDVAYSIPFACNFGICNGSTTANTALTVPGSPPPVLEGEETILEFRQIVVKDPDCTPAAGLPQISTCPAGQNDALRTGIFIP